MGAANRSAIEFAGFSPYLWASFPCSSLDQFSCHDAQVHLNCDAEYPVPLICVTASEPKPLVRFIIENYLEFLSNGMLKELCKSLDPPPDLKGCTNKLHYTTKILDHQKTEDVGEANGL